MLHFLPVAAATAPYTVSPTNPPGSESFTTGAIAGSTCIRFYNYTNAILSLGTTIVVILFLLFAAALGTVIVILRKRKKLKGRSIQLYRKTKGL